MKTYLFGLVTLHRFDNEYARGFELLVWRFKLAYVFPKKKFTGW